MPTYRLSVELKGVRKPLTASSATVSAEASDPCAALCIYNALFCPSEGIGTYYMEKITISRDGNEITPSALECDVSDFKARHWADFSKGC